MNDRDDMAQCYSDTLVFADDMVGRYGHLVVAAALCTIACSIYKTVLDPEEYHSMMDAISDHRNSVKSFRPPDVLN
jgi:hypothetical protein